MSAWYDGRLAGFDIETTSTDVETARVVTASIVFCGGGEPTESYSVLIDPGVEIPEEAAAVHGITTEIARANGTAAADAIPTMVELLKRNVAADLPMVAFNARFDFTIADREARRHGLAPAVPGFVFDPLVTDKHLHRFRKGERTLAAMCEHYGAMLPSGGTLLDRIDEHDATVDAIAACRLAWTIATRGSVIRRARNRHEGMEFARLQREWAEIREDPAALHAAQVRWAAEQAASLQEYFRRGNPAKDLAPDPTAIVEREWPVVTYRPEAVAA